MVFSPDDGHIFGRNMYRKAIKILRKLILIILLTKVLTKTQLYFYQQCGPVSVFLNLRQLSHH